MRKENGPEGQSQDKTPWAFISSFTPVNRPPITSSLIGEADLHRGQLDDSSALPKVTPVRGRKTNAGQLSTPPSTLKKSKTAKPRQPKQSKKESSLKNQDISKNLARTKPKHPGQEFFKDADGYISSSNVQLTKVPSQVTDDGVQLSARTAGKLAAFKYNGSPYSGLRNTYQAAYSTPISSTEREFTMHTTSEATETGENVLDPTYVAIHPEGYVDGIRNLSSNDNQDVPGEIIDNEEFGTPMHEATEELLRLLTGGQQSSKDIAVTDDREVAFYESNNGPRPLLSPNYMDLWEDLVRGQDETLADPSKIHAEANDDNFANVAYHHKNTRSDDMAMNDIDFDAGKAEDTRIQTVSEEDNHQFSDEDQAFDLLEDDYPMEDEDIEDMMQMPAVQESFAPPSSLQFAFDDNSQTNEIYDSNLQHSRPSSSKSVHTAYKDGKIIPITRKTTLGASFPPTVRPFSSYSIGLSPEKLVCEANIDLVEHVSNDEDFLGDDDDDEPEFLELIVNFSEEQQSILPTRISGGPKLQWNLPTLYKAAQSSSPSAKKSSPSNTSAPLPSVSESSSTPSSSYPAAPHLIAFDSNRKALPFVRPSFPAPIRDRSPILGLSSNTVLRTCFRIGEALNAASSASRSNTEAIVELYARVTYSEREASGLKQHFQFADLFRSERPPFLSGAYDLWKGVEPWDCESKAFLGENGKGRIARVVGTMRRDEKSKGWKMMILSVWEAGWTDVGFAKGIICG